MPRGKAVSTQETTVAVEQAVKSSAKKASYTRTTTGDIVYMHKSRATGATIAVLRGPAELGFGSQAKWVSLCLSHHQFSIFETRVLATSMSTRSDSWCTECAAKSKRRGKKAA